MLGEGTQASPVSLLSVHNVSAAVGDTAASEGNLCSGKGYFMSLTGKTRTTLWGETLGGETLGAKALGRTASVAKSFVNKTLACKTLGLVVAGCVWFLPAQAAEREQVRMVINLVAGVKMPFPGNVRNSIARTERVQLDTNGATVACLRLDDKQRWCYEHIAPVGARAEMLRVRSEPADGPLVGQVYHYVDDYDLDGAVDVGSTTKLEGQPYAPVGVVSQFFHRGTNRGDQFRGDYQKLYDDGIQIALKFLGE